MRLRIKLFSYPYLLFTCIDSCAIIELCDNRGNEVLARQLLRSATSIGANVREAVYGVSRADFIAKLQIALKETAETEYWIELLQATETLQKEQGEKLKQDCIEIKRILIATLKSSKSNAT